MKYAVAVALLTLCTASITKEPPKIAVLRDFFKTREEALADVEKTGYFAMDYLSTGPTPELPIHWHDIASIGYVLNGTTYLRDGDGNKVELSAGDKLVLPAGSVHAEGAVDEPVLWMTTWEQDIHFLQGSTRMFDPDSYPDQVRLKYEPPLAVIIKFLPDLVGMLWFIAIKQLGHLGVGVLVLVCLGACASFSAGVLWLILPRRVQRGKKSN